MQKTESYKVRGTKVSPQADIRLSAIERRIGINSYKLMQMFVDALIRQADSAHNLTPEMEKVMATFEHLEGWGDALNLADPTVKMEIGEAFYILFDPEGKKKGCRAVHVTKPFFGTWKQNYNVQDMLERFMCCAFPSLYRRLRYIAVSRDCKSIFELLVDVVCELETEAHKQELREGFEDNDRGDFGQKPHEGQPYVRHHQKTIFEQDKD